MEELCERRAVGVLKRCTSTYAHRKRRLGVGPPRSDYQPGSNPKCCHAPLHEGSVRRNRAKTPPGGPDAEGGDGGAGGATPGTPRAGVRTGTTPPGSRWGTGDPCRARKGSG